MKKLVQCSMETWSIAPFCDISREKKGVMIVSAEKLSPYYYKGLDCRAYLEMGCHAVGNGQYRFRVWAPNARSVSVVGDFNGWDITACPMERLAGGVFQVELAGYDALRPGQRVQAIVVHGGQVPADRLITRIVPLDEVSQAFQALAAGGDVKVLVDCGGDA